MHFIRSECHEFICIRICSTNRIILFIVLKRAGKDKIVESHKYKWIPYRICTFIQCYWVERQRNIFKLYVVFPFCRTRFHAVAIPFASIADQISTMHILDKLRFSACAHLYEHCSGGAPCVINRQSLRIAEMQRQLKLSQANQKYCIGSSIIACWGKWSVYRDMRSTITHNNFAAIVWTYVVCGLLFVFIWHHMI